MISFHLQKSVLIFFTCLFLFVFQQSKAQSQEIIQISYGSSYGECEGYCYSESIFKDDILTSISKSWGDTIVNPTKVTKHPLDNKLWLNLKNSIILNDFYSLEETIGCPDCVDGGASWVEVKTESKTYKVNYEYGEIPNVLSDFFKTLHGF